MQAIMQLKARRSAELERHPFVQWLDAIDVDIDDALMFAPIMTNFVMNFRDMNLWVIRFDEQPREHFRRIINTNTYEDETHSRLFLEDWEELGLDDRLGWSAGDTLWWLFASPKTECFRRYGVDFIDLCVQDGGDPMLRFAHSEAGEACGHVFFRHVVEPTARLRERTGLNYRYFGHYHLERELGHVLESEGEFEHEVLDPPTRARGLALGERMFSIFFGIFDAFADYVDTYVRTDSIPRAPTDPVEALPARPHEALDLPPPSAPPAVGAQQLERVLEARKQAAARHPLFRWLRDADVGPADKLRRFLPLWVMDVMGYRDLNHYVFYYPEPRDRHERLLNAWSADLESHSTLLFSDWRALGMDEHLGWRARQTLEFCFFDPSMDVHRRNIISFIKAGLRHRDPVMRFWLMHALESSGDAFFASTRLLALAAEAQGSEALDYLADRHAGAHPTPAHSCAARVRAEFATVPLTPEQLQVAEGMIHMVFDALEEQLSLSLAACIDDRFGCGRPRAPAA